VHPISVLASTATFFMASTFYDLAS